MARLNEKTIRGLLEFYDAKEVRGLFLDYSREVEQIVDKSLRFLKEKDYPSLARALHALKGASGTVGASFLFSLAEEAERAAAGGVPGVRQKVEAVRGELLRFLAEAEVFLSEVS